MESGHYRNTFKIIYYEKGSVNFQTKTVSGTTFKTDLAGLQPGKTYKWFVQTVCSNGSYYSQVANFNTLGGPLNCGSTPQNPGTINIRSKSAIVQWYPTSADQFMVRYKISGTTAYDYTTVTGATYASGGLKLKNLIPATSYEWSVMSNCNSVNSLYSKPVTFVTYDECPVPMFIYQTAVTNTSATIHWDANYPADTVKIRFYEKGTTNYQFRQICCTPNNPGYTIINGLKPETDYIYMVRGKCAWGISDFTSDKEFLTLPNPNIPISNNPDDELKLIGYPNPASILFNYGFLSPEEGEYTVKVCDMTGRIIMSETKGADKGINGGSLAVEKLANGIYTLVLQKKAQVSRFRFSVH